MDADQDRPAWLSVEAVASRLGVSPATIKRRIHDGKPVRIAGNRSVEIEAEQVARPQGHEWQVRIKTALPPIRTVLERSDSEEQAPISSAQDDSGTITALRDIIEADRETIAALHAENADLRERVGRAEARSELETKRADDLAARLADAERRLARPWWRFWST